MPRRLWPLQRVPAGRLRLRGLPAELPAFRVRDSSPRAWPRPLSHSAAASSSLSASTNSTLPGATAPLFGATAPLRGTTATVPDATASLPGLPALPRTFPNPDLIGQRLQAVFCLACVCLLPLGTSGCKGQPGAGRALTFDQPQSAVREGRARSLESKTPATMDFVNLTPRDLRLFWLDFRGQRHLYADIGAGRKVTQKTFLTHWWLVATPRGHGLAIFHPQARNSTVLIDPLVAPRVSSSASGLRSAAGGRPTTLRFVNPTDEAVNLFWIDYRGASINRGQIAAHSELSQPTYAGHAWLVSDVSGRGKAFFVAKPTSQTAIVAPSAGD